MKYKFRPIAGITLLFLTAPALQAGILVDGTVTTGEYANTSSQTYKLDRGNPTTGDVTLHWELVGNNLNAAFVIDNNLVDNCYGTAAAGSTAATNACGYENTGGNHPFGDLRGSDKALIILGDGSNSIAFTMDYLIKDSWVGAGSATAGEGGEGSGGTLLSKAESSMTYNINANSDPDKWSATTSPELNSDWDGTLGPGGYDITGNSLGIAVWDFMVTYEFEILAANLTGLNLSSLNIDVNTIHISDAKGWDHGHVLTKCTVNDDCGSTPPPSVPEPTTLALMGLGLFGLGFNRGKRFL